MDHQFHGVYFSFLGEYKGVLLATGYFTHFIGNAVDVVGSHFVCVLAYSQLTLFTLAAHEKSSNIVYKSRVTATCGNFFNIRPVIVIKVHLCWLVDTLHPSAFSFGCNSTLTKLIITPRIYVSSSCLDQ